MVEYHTYIQGIEAKNLGKGLANTRYNYQEDVFGGLAKKLEKEDEFYEKESIFKSFLEPGKRTTQGLYVVEGNLRSAWNCCKNNPGNKKHPEFFKGLSVENLVGDLGDGLYGYEYLIEVSETLQNEWLTQSQGDEMKGRVQLASKLKECYQNMGPVIKGLKGLEHQYQLFMLLAFSN